MIYQIKGFLRIKTIAKSKLNAILTIQHTLHTKHLCTKAFQTIQNYKKQQIKLC